MYSCGMAGEMYGGMRERGTDITGDGLTNLRLLGFGLGLGLG